MNVLLMILRIIGILILVLLGIVVLLLLIIFLVPIRYGGTISYEEKCEGDVHVTWFLHLVHFRVKIHENHPDISLRIFGKKKKEKSKEEKKNKKKDNSSKVTSEDIETKATSVPEVVEEVDIKGFETAKEEGTSAIEVKEDSPALVDKSKKTIKRKKKKKNKKENNEEPKQSFLEKIKELWYSLKQKMISLLNNLSEKKKMLSHYLHLLEQDRTDAALALVKKRLISLLRHMAPRRLSGHLYFGMDDPATTGTIAGICAMTLPIYKNHFEIVPDFSNEVLDANIKFRGRINIGYVLILVANVWFNKNVKYVIAGLKKIKEHGGNKNGRE